MTLDCSMELNKNAKMQVENNLYRNMKKKQKKTQKQKKTKKNQTPVSINHMKINQHKRRIGGALS